MAIIRNGNDTMTAQFSVTLNVVLKGSKKLSPQEQEALMSVAQVRVLIVDAGDPDNVLVDQVVPAREFGTGSVGYGLTQGSAQFTKA